ncbi:MAG: MutS-related protein [Clostridium sp.]|uniref:MutS-related protein n=1 Tax=Clostridium sp. TaxID=1506 RepID=UPI003F2AFF44
MDGIFIYGVYVIIIVVAMMIAGSFTKYKFKKRCLENIRNLYGTRKHMKDDYVNHGDDTDSYFLNSKEEGFYLDNITWNDFNMNEIFKLMANTNTSIGSEYLYKSLRSLEFDKRNLDKRKALIQFFKENKEIREDISLELKCLGRKNSARLSDYFMKENKTYKMNFKLFKILRYLPIPLIALSFFSPIFILLIILNITANVIIHMRVEKKLEYRMQDYVYLINMVLNAKKIYSKNIKEVNKYYKEVQSAIEKTICLKRKNTGSKEVNMGNDMDIFSEYVAMLTLKNVVNYGDIEEVVLREGERIKEIYDFIGELDALIGVASFTETLDQYCIPEFAEEKKIEFEDIYNPLIKNPVKNGFAGSNGVLITGSNASGKSTFLRSIGLNVVLAQSFNIACASKFKIPTLRVFSSMALSDSIMSNDSYYMAEIKSIKRILEFKDENFICFIDEVLRGTNTLERIAASSEILNKLGNMKNCICFGATHDIELTYILKNSFKNYSFEEKIEDNKIKFDYKLKEGASKTKNAIKILEFMGYEEDIVDRANGNVEYFIKNSSWKEI